MNKETLLFNVNEHKKRCFHKSSCEICTINKRKIDGVYMVECDWCNRLYYNSYMGYKYYMCKCLKRDNVISLCHKCNTPETHDSIGIEKIPEELYDSDPDTDDDEIDGLDEMDGLFTDDCCPLTTKAAQ